MLNFSKGEQRTKEKQQEMKMEQTANTDGPIALIQLLETPNTNIDANTIHSSIQV
jgi:hypothetical protein